MKRNRMGKKLLASVLSIIMVMNCGISVFADEIDSETQSETEIVVTIPEPEVTITSSEDMSMDDDGNMIITTTTITEGQDESSSYYEEENSSVLIDWEGNVVEESGVVEGSQTYEGEVEEDIEIRFDKFEEGETASGASEEKTEVIGDLKENEADTTYDQTTITETAKEVSGTLNKVEVLEGNKDIIKDFGLVVGNKVQDHENNADKDNTNDAYNVDIIFALAVTVADNDDLIVKILDGSGKLVRTVRLAGDDSTTNYGIIKPDEKGNYAIKKLELVEGASAFNMTLEGAKNLEEGLYVYTAEDGEVNDQTEKHSVNVEFEFAVNDGKQTISRVWADQWYGYDEPVRDTETEEPEESEDIETEEPETKPDVEGPSGSNGNSDSTPGIKPNRPSYNNKTENYTVGEEGLVEIEDEEVPLADAPETGDVAIMCLAAAAVSGLGFTGLTLKAKKNEDEE